MSAHENEFDQEPKDYTRLVWIGIAVLFLGLIGAMYYLANKDDTNRSVVRIRHILVKFNPQDPVERQRAFESITSIREQLVGGADFSTLAKEWSQDGSASRGGDIGYVFRGDLDPAVEEAAWTLPLNQLSEVVTSGFGFHVIEVMDRKLSKMDIYQRELEKEVEEKF